MSSKGILDDSPALDKSDEKITDEQRFDFIEAKAATVYCSMNGHWVFVDERGKKHEERRGVLGISVRGCIDAAMKASK